MVNMRDLQTWIGENVQKIGEDIFLSLPLMSEEARRTFSKWDAFKTTGNIYVTSFSSWQFSVNFPLTVFLLYIPIDILLVAQVQWKVLCMSESSFMEIHQKLYNITAFCRDVTCLTITN